MIFLRLEFFPLWHSIVERVLAHCDLIHWDRATHMCVSDPSLVQIMACRLVGAKPLSEPRQAIIWTNVGMLLTRPLGTIFNEIFIEIHTFSFKKIHFKMSSGKWQAFCLGRNVFTHCGLILAYICSGNVFCLIIPIYNLHQCWLTFNTLRPRRGGRHFPDDIFKFVPISPSLYYFFQIACSI